jgi:hypothetical protein
LGKVVVVKGAEKEAGEVAGEEEEEEGGREQG